jgi:hypothetical protein
VDAAPLEEKSSDTAHNSSGFAKGVAADGSTIIDIVEDEIVTFEGSGSADASYEGNYTKEGLREDEILFEGDIKISIEDLQKYYDINETKFIAVHGISHENHISKRAAMSDENKLWPAGRV